MIQVIHKNQHQCPTAIHVHLSSGFVSTFLVEHSLLKKKRLIDARSIG